MNTAEILSRLKVLDGKVAGQTLLAWTGFVVIWALVFIALRVPKKMIARRVTALAAARESDIWNLIGELVRRISSIFLLIVGLYIASDALKLSARGEFNIDVALIVAFIFQGALWMDETASYLIAMLIRAEPGDDEGSIVSTIEALKFFARLAVWSIAILLVLDNLKVNITTLIAGLGIGGVAIALALNQILGDFFASMSILLGKPFDVGHFIMFDNFSGTVEHIGFKTTRMRNITGEELIVGNASLLQSRIRNFRRLRERRVLFVLTVGHFAAEEHLEQIPALLGEIIGKVPKARFERAHLKDYAAASLNFEVVYWVEDQELMTYLDAQQRISLEVLKKFRELGIPITGITQPPM
jgi:small-conductance mechanosensitive channel